MDITVHVDDGKVTSDDDGEIENLLSDLKERFVHLKVQDGKVFDHLGMHFVYDGEGHVEVTMSPFTVDLVEKWPEVGMKVASTPHTSDLFKVEDSIKLVEDERQRFRSAAQSCL